jgi:branched-chain amino acid transport system ATP-binding protein
MPEACQRHDAQRPRSDRGTANRTSCGASFSGARRGRDSAGAQRRRQDHYAEVDQGHGGAAPGIGETEGTETIDLASVAASASPSAPRCGIFSSLDVEENLLLPPQVKEGGLSLTEIFELFPNLKERLRSQGTKLSGGEQQMLAIGRILRTGAHLLMLDEPTEGLAPVIVQHIGRTVATLSGVSILLVEQNFRFAATVADRHYVMERGRIVDMIPNAELDANMKKLHEYLGV